MADLDATPTFAGRLRTVLAARGPLCVGIDPHPGLLARWNLPDDAAGLARFAALAVEAVAGEVAVVKPQSAFFERHGSAGIAVLESTVTAARAAGALVLLDAKRGDIGSTVQAYADAYLRPGAPLAADALTVSPYLGFGSLRPFVDVARAAGTGVFVLVLTSNPEGTQVQRAVTASGRTVAGALLADIAAENASIAAPGAASGAASGAPSDGVVGAGPAPFGSVGAVVGATVADVDEDLDCGGPLLAPGVGAQGGTAADVRRLFAGVTERVLPAVSRDVLVAGPDPASMRTVALRWRDQMAEALGV